MTRLKHFNVKVNLRSLCYVGSRCCIPSNVLSSRHWTIQFSSIRPSIYPSMPCFLHICILSNYIYRLCSMLYSVQCTWNICFVYIVSAVTTLSKIGSLLCTCLLSLTPSSLHLFYPTLSTLSFVHFHSCNDSGVIALCRRRRPHRRCNSTYYVVGVKKAHPHRHAYPQSLENKWT